MKMATGLEDTATVVDVLNPASARMSSASAARSAAALEKEAAKEPATVEVKLPPPLARMVATILREIAQGNTVAVMTTAEEVTTGVAARMLGVSRPHVANLIDAGVLPGRRVNKHRRVRLADVVAYRREQDRRNPLLKELTELSEEMGGYEHPGQEPRAA